MIPLAMLLLSTSAYSGLPYKRHEQFTIICFEQCDYERVVLAKTPWIRHLAAHMRTLAGFADTLYEYSSSDASVSVGTGPQGSAIQTQICVLCWVG